MDRLSTIEQAFKDVLLTIDQNTVNPSGYVYYNTVTVVNQGDETVGNYPKINIYLDPEEVALSGEQNAYRNTAKFKLICKVIVDDSTPNPTFAINQQMNSLLSDIKYVLSANYQLNGECDRADIVKSSRVYDELNVRLAQLVVYVDVLYSQSRLNPDINACV